MPTKKKKTTKSSKNSAKTTKSVKKVVKKKPAPKIPSGKKKPKKIIFKASGKKAKVLKKADKAQKSRNLARHKSAFAETEPYAEKEAAEEKKQAQYRDSTGQAQHHLDGAQAPPSEDKTTFEKIGEKSLFEKTEKDERLLSSEGEGAGKKRIALDIPITVKDFAAKLNIKPNELMKTMIEKGIFVTINQSLDEEVVNNIARIYEVEIEKLPTLEENAFREEKKEDEKNFVSRAPVVTLMGHVDHGKTSLLDMIRKTKIATKEYGGITQHIGAYEVMLKKGAVTFLDTPGHEAFTEMRARGANATDIVVLVIAADDGIKPQTIEAIDHARAAEVPIVVALNKCDLPHINADNVKTQLSKLNLMPEDWGGKTIVTEVSAKTGKGIDNLLEMLLLEAELLELSANPGALARGVVIESQLSRGRGVAVTVLVQNGTLRLGDMVVCGIHYGRIKAMINDKGVRVSEAPPSMPIEILGLSGVPQAGEKFFVAKDEKKARAYCMQKETKERERQLSSPKHVSLEGLYHQIEKGQIKELKVIIKADVSGSIEALRKSLAELSTKDVKINVIHSAAGNVNESDVMLALASNAVVIGFHVKAGPKPQIAADKKGVQVKLYNIIYEATADVKAAMEGMLEPISKEVSLGKAQIRKIFTTSKSGVIAGCYVVKGKISRKAIVKLIRGGNIIYEGRISSLKRFKDDIKEAAEGFECGIVLTNHNNVKEGDIIEAFEIQKIARRLEK